MKKTMTSKKKAKEETEKNNKFDQARSKKEVLNLISFFLKNSFLPFRAPERPSRGWGSAAGDYACACEFFHIFEKTRARASAGAHFSKVGREASV